MQRIINDPKFVVEDMLEGVVKAHENIYAFHPENKKVIVHKNHNEILADKVGVVTGGGSGHEPGFLGYCGENMLDAVAIGEIFSSPSAQYFLDAFKYADNGNGVACLYGNYAGDNMNVKMATKMAAREGITVKSVIANDDVASAPKDEREKRRGVAGEILMWKVAGALANQGASLDEIIAAAQKTIDNCRSVGVGLSACTIPANGKPNFSIDDGMMEFGIGHHGEPGIEVRELENATEIAHKMVDIILNDYDFKDRVLVVVSGLGSTPLMEQYIFYSEVVTLLNEKNLVVTKSFVGNYFTSLEMNGLTLTIMQLDDELEALIDTPVHTMHLKGAL